MRPEVGRACADLPARRVDGEPHDELELTCPRGERKYPRKCECRCTAGGLRAADASEVGPDLSSLLVCGPAAGGACSCERECRCM